MTPRIRVGLEWKAAPITHSNEKADRLTVIVTFQRKEQLQRISEIPQSSTEQREMALQKTVEKQEPLIKFQHFEAVRQKAY